MGMLAIPQWEIFARELVEVELASVIGMETQRAQLRHRAYQKAGFAGNIDNARRLANNPRVKARFRELFKEALEFRDVNVVKVVNRIDRVGRANIADLYDVDGKTLKNIKELPREISDAIESVKHTDNGPEVRMHDKNQANFTLLKHLGGLPEAQQPAANVNILSVLNVDDQRALAEALEAIPSGPASVDREAEGERSSE
jgi:hypothetical protein